MTGIRHNMTNRWQELDIIWLTDETGIRHNMTDRWQELDIIWLTDDRN